MKLKKLLLSILTVLFSYSLYAIESTESMDYSNVDNDTEMTTESDVTTNENPADNNGMIPADAMQLDKTVKNEIKEDIMNNKMMTQSELDQSKINQKSKSMLYRLRAIETSNKLLKKNLKDIYILEVATINFGSENHKEKLKAIFSEYKQAIKLFYTHQYIISENILIQNTKTINSLYESILTVYKKELDILLNNAVDSLLAAQITLSNKSNNSAFISAKQVLNSRSNIESAYDYLNYSKEAVKLMDYHQGLTYLRMSNLFAIQAIMNVATSEKSREALNKKYQKYFLDIDNLTQTKEFFISNIYNTTK